MYSRNILDLIKMLHKVFLAYAYNYFYPYIAIKINVSEDVAIVAAFFKVARFIPYFDVLTVMFLNVSVQVFQAATARGRPKFYSSYGCCSATSLLGTPAQCALLHSK